MAYLQARAGIARAGVTYAGWTPPSVTLYLAGVNRTTVCLQNGDFVLTERANGEPPTLTFSIKTITPVEGQAVVLLYATPDEYLFAGTILELTAQPEAPDSQLLVWRCVAVGYQWLLDRYDRPLVRYPSRGVNVIVADLLSRWTDGGFVPGYVPQALGDLAVEFGWTETISQDLERLAAATGATLEITPERRVNLFQVSPEADLPTLTNALVLQDSLRYRRDLTQVRTRTRVAGRGSTVAVAAPFAATTLTVQDTTPFSTAGGNALVNVSLITYTGKSVGSGLGTLTGVSGLVEDAEEGEDVQTVVTTADGASQTALAALLGGGLSGQATHVIEDAALSMTEEAARGAADLTTFATALPELTFTYTTVQRHLTAGRILPVSITVPVAISGDFIIQSVTTTIHGVLGGVSVDVFQTIEASRYTRTLNKLLQVLVSRHGR